MSENKQELSDRLSDEKPKMGILQRVYNRISFEAEFLGMFLREVFYYPNHISRFRIDDENYTLGVRRHRYNLRFSGQDV